MSFDLATVVPNVIASVDAPGFDTFPDALTTDWLLRLRNAFWDCRLDGFLSAWQENADNVTPGIVTAVAPGGTDIPRDMVQLVIFYAAMDAVVNQLRQLRTQFKAQAGPVSFEYQQSANSLRDVLKVLTDRKKQLFEYLSAEGVIAIGYSDGVINRDIALFEGITSWVGAGSYVGAPYGYS